MPSKNLVLGYHGCDFEVAQALVSGKSEFKLSTNTYDWLGKGIYFWEDSPHRAMQWAEKSAEASKGKIQKPAVVGAVMNLGVCLNLIDAAHQTLVKQTYEDLLEKWGAENLPKNKGKDLRQRNLDCFVLEAVHEKSKINFDTTRAFFTEGKALYPGAGLRINDHIQIAVRNPACIQGVFFPPELKQFLK